MERRGDVAEIQRARMLRAALEAVDAHGYAGFTVAHVTQRAKVSRKTFYEVFAHREDCFAELFEQGIAQIGSRMSEAYAQQSSWREGVRAAVGALLAFVDEQPALGRLCVVDALAAGPDVLERRLWALRRIYPVVDLGRREREGRREPPQVAAEGAVGAVLSVLHTRLLQRSSEPYSGLVGQLTSMLVLPYLGAAAAGRELARPLPARRRTPASRGDAPAQDPLAGIDMRLTYRTVRVLQAIARGAGASNREVAEVAGISDQGQMSKLLARLERLELVENIGDGLPRGAPNRWRLTARGQRVEHATHGPGPVG